MTPVERVCAILAERDVERMGVPPCEHTERLRKDLALGWKPTAERIDAVFPWAAADALHAQALERVFAIMDATADTPEGAELYALTVAIEAYEAVRWPMTASQLPAKAPPETYPQATASSMPCEVQSGCGEASKRVWPWWL